MCGCVSFHPVVESFDLVRRPTFGLNDRLSISYFVITDGQQGSEDNPDVMSTSKFCHRHQIIFNRLQRRWTSVAGKIVSGGENNNDFWFQLDHVTAKTNKHLRCRLSADAAIDVWLAGKETA